MSVVYHRIRAAFEVRRYHTVPYMVKEETVGHHTANLIALLFFLFDDDPPLELIRHALHHDVPEVVTGDLPAPFKWETPEIQELLAKVEAQVAQAWGLSLINKDGEHAAIFKYADIMELCFKSVDEMAAGNMYFVELLKNGIMVAVHLLQKHLKGHKQAVALFEMLQCNKFVEVQAVILEVFPNQPEKQNVH